jgi:tRNA G26 N,N-dimethylase Trm1
MTESQRIVLHWKAHLKAAGWPEDAIKEIVHGLCEAGYRACIEEIQARTAKTDALIAKVATN